RAGRLYRHREPAARHGVDRRRARARLAGGTAAGRGGRHRAVTVFTHILATTLGVQAMELHGRDAALAYAFGIGVDVDHAEKEPFYLRAVGPGADVRRYWRW